MKKYEKSEFDLKKLVAARETDLKEQQRTFDEAGNPDFDNLINLETCMKNQLHQIGESIKESLREEIQANNKQMEQKINQVMLQSAFTSDEASRDTKLIRFLLLLESS